MSEGQLRKGLGDFSSIVCLKAIVTGLEEIMGVKAARGNLVLAGRKRGKAIAEQLGLVNTDKPVEEWSAMVRDAIGKKGTCLCDIVNVAVNNEIIRVDLLDTVCSAGEEPGSPRQLTFTLGAIQGVLEEITGRRMTGKQVASVLRGGEFDSIEFTVR